MLKNCILPDIGDRKLCQCTDVGDTVVLVSETFR